MTSISLQGEPGESGSPGVQGEPGVKVSGCSEALLPKPLLPLIPTPTFTVTSWSRSTPSHSQGSLVPGFEWALPPFLERKRGTPPMGSTSVGALMSVGARGGG